MGLFHRLFVLLTDNPKVITILFLVTIFLYILLLSEEGDFSDYFLHFGPGTNENNTGSFFNIKINNWKRTISGYFLSFLTGVLVSYYSFITTDYLTTILDSREKYIYDSKLDVTLMIIFQPVIFTLVYASGFVSSVFQLQFIIFFLLGGLLMIIPYSIYRLKGKKFLNPKKSYNKVI